MQEIDYKKLNEKLATFCGFKKMKYGKGYFLDGSCGVYELPDLVNDPKAQQTFIYPKLRELKMDFTIYYYWFQDVHSAMIFDDNPTSFESKSPTVAFALACNEVIDHLILKENLKIV